MLACAWPVLATVREEWTISRDPILRRVTDAKPLGPARRYRGNGIECTAEGFSSGSSPLEAIERVAEGASDLGLRGFRKTGSFDLLESYARSYAVNARRLSVVLVTRLNARTTVLVAHVECGDIATLGRAAHVPTPVTEAARIPPSAWTN